jgi:hypothetical protein
MHFASQTSEWISFAVIFDGLASHLQLYAMVRLRKGGSRTISCFYQRPSVSVIYAFQKSRTNDTNLIPLFLSLWRVARYYEQLRLSHEHPLQVTLEQGEP